MRSHLNRARNPLLTRFQNSPHVQNSLHAIFFFHSPHHVQYPRHVRELLWEVPADVIACHGTRAVEGIRRVTKFLREKGDIYARFGEPTCMQVY